MNTLTPERARALQYFPAVETHTLRSTHVSQTFQIQVMRPPQIRGKTRRVPVVYVTDGNAAFDMCKGISWLMQGSERESPPFILVAIGYPGDSPCAGALLRGRDFSFPGCPDYLSGLEVLSEWEGIHTPEEGQKSFCGAEDFQRFLAEELIPFIDGKYETVRGDCTYFGHSMGGSFGLFTLFTQPELFRRYVLSSPAISYHGQTPNGAHYEKRDFLLQRARDFVASGKTLDGICLYMSVGTQEQFEPLIANWEFTSGFYRLTALLRKAAIPGLTLMTEALVGESHTTSWPIAFTHGIQAVFGTRMISNGAT
ncbi:MAG: alpha/beta hydrolase [Gammaproteobacteria bacterium]|nr:alpha/beta hydrolase [Gammaproteobacteria bacterium]